MWHGPKTCRELVLYILWSRAIECVSASRYGILVREQALIVSTDRSMYVWGSIAAIAKVAS